MNYIILIYFSCNFDSRESTFVSITSDLKLTERGNFISNYLFLKTYYLTSPSFTLILIPLPRAFVQILSHGLLLIPIHKTTSTNFYLSRRKIKRSVFKDMQQQQKQEASQNNSPTSTPTKKQRLTNHSALFDAFFPTNSIATSALDPLSGLVIP